MRKKLLYVAPHLSTGGQPQYLYKQVKEFIKDFEIEVVEINNSGGDAFVVQKNRIKSVVPIHTLGEDKSEILKVIAEFNPDIIHFQEIPQFDLAPFILDQIFTKDRNYFIIASTHGSFTNPSEIIYHPDRYILVSEWSRQRFIDTGVETMLWEYPIEEYKFDKQAAQKELGFESDWKHILNVGLFAPGKNQAEIFAIATQFKNMYSNKFIYQSEKLYCYNGVYWKPESKDELTTLNMFICTVFYEDLKKLFRQYEDYQHKKENVDKEQLSKKLQDIYAYIRHLGENDNDFNMVIDMFNNYETFIKQVYQTCGNIFNNRYEHLLLEIKSRY
jgi:hypothetical protein